MITAWRRPRRWCTSTIDGDLSQVERDMPHDAEISLQSRRAGTARHIDAAIAVDKEAVDLYHFTT
jgi:hypothetical protein